MTEVIDNDFHPDDRLDNDADQGHWGTKLYHDSIEGRYTYMQSNVGKKSDSEKKPIRDRYGDRGGDLPTYREDNEYSYRQVRDK